MKVTVEVDATEFSAALSKYAAASHRDFREVLREEAGLLSVALVKVTPPFQTFGGRESLGAQRRVGQAAVRRDIYRAIGVPSNIFQMLSKVDPTAPKKYWAILKRPASRGGGEAAAMKFAESVVSGASQGQTKVSHTVDRNAHTRVRNRFGRVPRGTQVQQIVTVRARRAYLREQLGKVGVLKAGHAMGAMRYRGGRGIPAWIQKHAFRAGRVVDGASGGHSRPFIDLVNTVRYARIAIRPAMMAFAVENRRRALVAKIRAALRSHGRRYSSVA